jgi:hypothetical protein
MRHTPKDLSNPLLRYTTFSKISTASSRVCSTHRHRRSVEGNKELGQDEEDCLLPSSFSNWNRWHRLPALRWSSSSGWRAQRVGVVVRHFAVSRAVRIGGRWQNFFCQLFREGSKLAISVLASGAQLFPLFSMRILARWKQLIRVYLRVQRRRCFKEHVSRDLDIDYR